MNMRRIVSIVLAGVLVFASCGPKKASEPSAQDFAPYIKAFTGGIVTEDATIRIELAEDATEQPTDGLFSFKPSIKGSVKWNGPQSVTFVPEDGSLKVGQTYKASFALGKLIPGAPEVFPFGITVKGNLVAVQETEAEPDNGRAFRVVQASVKDNCVEVKMSEAPANATVKGLVELTGVSRSYVQVQDQTIKVHFEGRKGDITLTLDKGLKGVGGSALGDNFTRVFPETEEVPAVRIPFNGSILPDKQCLLLPFSAVNLSAVEVRVVKIYEKNILMYLQDNSLGGDSELRRSGRLIYKGDIALDATKDLHQWNDHCIDLSGLFRQEPGAIYRIRLSFRQDQSLYGGKEPVQTVSKPVGKPSKEDEAVWDKPDPYYWDNYYDWDEYKWNESNDPNKPSYYMDSGRFPAVQLLSSDLGLMADYAGGSRIWIAATDLITAKPVPGAKLEVFDFQLQSIARGKTDGNGLATLTLDVNHKPFAVVAKAGGSTSYLKVTSGYNERSTSRFDVGGEVLQQGIKAYIYGERGVWRPGDTLHVTAVVADRGKTLPEGHPATLEVYTPEGQFYSKLTRKGTDGFYGFDIPTKADDPTGYWNAYLKVGGSSFHKVLHVETVKPNRLKINTFYPAVMEAGKTVNLQASAAWLSGGVAGNMPVRAQVTLRKAGGSPFKGFEKYAFYAPSSNYDNSELELYKARLDASGNLNAKVTLPAAQNAPGMLQAFVVTTVQEPGGDESFTTETIPYSPYNAYVGVRVPEGEFLETDKAHTFSIAVVDPSGRRLASRKVEYAIYKTGWNWWWDNAGGSLDAYVHGSSVQKVQTGTMVSGTQDATFTFRVDYPAWGNYLVMARDVASGHVSGASFTVDWPEYRGRADRRDPEALTMLTFSTDKPSYKVGEKATVYIPAAEGGQALVTLENAGGVISREWVQTSSKDTPWSFTVTPEMAPNIYAGVTLIQPYGSVENDLPIRLYGVQRIKVENPGSHLEPVVTMPDVIHPEETFTVKVSERNGRPMTYTIAIVDEGLLDLTAFKTPDPWSRMYRNEALTVATWDNYDQVIGAFGGKLSPLAAIGGDEDAVRNARKDNRFNPVVLFRGPKTVAKGTDVLKLQLPMYVGSVRVMVVAGHDGAYGNTEKTVPVQSPLMVVTTLPRVLGSGEQTSAAVNVFAMEDGIGDATVSVKVDGPVSGGGIKTVKFTEKGDKLLQFPVTATDAEGVAHITINASAGGHNASETIALEVRNPNPAITTVEHFSLEKGASREVSGTSLQLASFPAIDAKGMYLRMKDYPYDCTEQLSARGLTMLHLLPLLPEADAAEARGLIPGIISQIYARQKTDGGFAYWTGGTSGTWVSSMAGLFLSEASKEGFEVNSGVLKNWKSYQQKMSQVFRVAGNNFFSNLDEAYRLYTLAVAGSPNLAGMNRLKEASKIGDQARWMLSSAYALSGKATLASGLLDGVSSKFPEYEPYNITFGTALRDQLIALDALALNDRVADALALAAELPLREMSTQESAFAAVAMGHLNKKVGNSAIHANVGGKEVVSAAMLASVPLSGPATVQNLSDGVLYGTVLSVSREGSRKAVSNGMSVEVRYTGENGSAIDPSKLAQGTRFTATIKVTGNGVRAHENLALNFGIPSGWEIVNDRLQGGSVSEDGYDYKDIRDDRVNWFFALPAGRSKTFSVQLRAAYEGSYVLPAVVCEAMYDPTVNAATASGKAVVTR